MNVRRAIGNRNPSTEVPQPTRAVAKGLALLLAVAWSATAGCAPGADGAGGEELTLASFVGPRHPVNENVFAPFTERLAELSNGQLQVRVFPGGTLNSSPPRQYPILLDGVADLAFVLPGYTADLFPKTNIISYPRVCSSPTDCTQAMQRALSVLEGEYDAKILAFWSGAPPVLVTRDRPVRALEDFRGLRIRVPSTLEFPFIEALGAVPVMQPANEIHQNLANGVIDGIAIIPSGITSFNLQDAGRYVTTWLPLSGMPFALLMNREAYDALTAEQRGWIDAAADSTLSLEAAASYTGIAAHSIEVAREAGLEIIELTDDERLRIDAAIAESYEAGLSEMAGDMTVGEVVRLYAGN
jgi:TRAP-type C4-dicarboxylate transport system substrate-binding protein